MKDQYDYIIVGAGSAGCGLANRLSADPSYSVLLVEAGPSDKTPLVTMPRGVGMLLNPGSKHIWEYELHTGGNKPPERSFTGKSIGGSSSVNGMVYMRGAPSDYDGWAAAGCEGWSWADVSRKFVELENHDQGAREWRGVGGPMRVTTHPKGAKLDETLIKAGEQMGLPRVDDINDPASVTNGGIGYQPTTRFKGERFNAARAFLDPIKSRPNLDVAMETPTLKVVFEGKRAAGVLVRTKDGDRTIQAKREVILSAGALQTPKLLQLSGVGPSDLLKSFGIPVVVDAPRVGKNLRDHRVITIRLKVKDPSYSQNRDLGGLRVLLSVLKYQLLRKGPMTHAAHEVGGFAKSTPGLDRTDMQVGLISVSASSSGKDGAVALDKHSGITLLTYFTRPESQGEVRIQSADPTVAPYVNANYIAEEGDRKKFVAAFRWLRAWAATPALSAIVAEESYPGPSVKTDDDILNVAMDLGGAGYHFIGTAAMGADPASVVDPKLKVRGVEGLRVADMSIAPTLVSGNTNGPALMIGLRAADLVIADRK